MNEWDLQSRSPACDACQQAFAAEQSCHTLLTFTSEGYRRQDLCAACWTSANRAGEISHWQGLFQPPPPPEQRDAVKKETAESLLRKLMESPDPAHANARYILAVMLERKRILKPRETSSNAEGQKLLVYEHGKSGETFLIADPCLRLDQLADVQQQVMALLTQPDSPAADSTPAQPSA